MVNLNNTGIKGNNSKSSKHQNRMETSYSFIKIKQFLHNWALFKMYNTEFIFDLPN